LLISCSMLGGIGLTMAAGVMSGNCMLPLKFIKRWRWENTWLLFSLVSLLVLPWMLSIALVRNLREIYAALPGTQFLAPVLFGAGWGVAQILFGLSVRRLGLGVGYAIIIGMGAVLGTLVPLFLGDRPPIPTASLAEIISGILVMMLGIVLTAWGGQVRERAGHSAAPKEPSQGAYLPAVLLAVLCGFLAPMLNYAFVSGQGLAVEAVLHGNTAITAAYAVWPIALLGGLIPNLAYSLVLLRRNKSWAEFRESPHDARYPVLMAVLWMGAFALYGMSTALLGVLGTSIGWGLFQIFMIMTATISGMLTAEWKSAPRSAIVFLTAGMAALVGATILLSLGGR
jgi:L-rhamnose-H+ transport protein